MWLLDVNMPNQLISLLQEFGVEAQTARSRGWQNLSNGALIEVAAPAGFSSLLTRDRLFGEAAARAFKRFPDFSVILITLPQARARLFLDEFRAAWSRGPIVPRPGQILQWPSF